MSTISEARLYGKRTAIQTCEALNPMKNHSEHCKAYKGYKCTCPNAVSKIKKANQLKPVLDAAKDVMAKFNTSLRHEIYRNHDHSPDSCSGCQDAQLLTDAFSETKAGGAL